MVEREYDRVELVWPGKGQEVERPPALPFQVIERVNDVRRSGASGQARLESAPPPPHISTINGEAWRNKLIWGDNKYVLSSLLEEFAGQVDLIYIDPPFATGDDFSYQVPVGDEEVDKLPSILEENAYRDTWAEGLTSYLPFMHERITFLRDLLSPTGSFYLHCDPTVSHYLKVVLDEIFGFENVRNEIVWCYPPTGQPPKLGFPRKHDIVFFYGRSANAGTWIQPYTEMSDATKSAYSAIDEDGRRYSKAHGKQTYLDEVKGRAVPSWWTDIGSGSHMPKTERVGYPTQKPLALLERIIKASSNPGDLVLDVFCGSGTTMVAAEQLERRWIGADLGRYAIQTSRKRMLELPECRPFEVVNLGRYERKHWQGSQVGEAIDEYYSFIAQLYRAERLHGFQHLHAQLDGRMVHVGATDSPVTAEELEDAVRECSEASTGGLDVLGWEWEMGLNPSGKEEIAARHGVDVRLLNIPREVMESKAVEAGDIHFFELSVVEVKAVQDDRGLTVKIENFLPALDEYMKEKVEGKIEEWSDWIDYWSVDYEYDGDTFVNSWQSYRTRQDRSLKLASDPHQYESAGEKTIVVKVIDIFGNDTTHEEKVVVS